MENKGALGLDERWMRAKYLTLLHLGQHSQNAKNLPTPAPSDFRWSPPVDGCQW